MNTFKRDYLRVKPRPDGISVLQRLPAWFEDYNTILPHSGLRMRSPREFIKAQSATHADCPIELGGAVPAPDGSSARVSIGPGRVRGFVDLRPEDAWYALRYNSQVVFWLPGQNGGYRRLVGGTEDERGHTVIREELGVRHEELVRFTATEAAADDDTLVPKAGSRGAQPHYDWDAARLEAFRRMYFEGVPESYGALIRHLQAWFAKRGGRVPDESTLKRRLRDIWASFGPEAQQPAA